MIAIIVLSVLLFLLFLYTISLSAKISKYQADTNDKVENIEPQQGQAGTPGPPGRIGPRGETGPAGGTFMSAGRLVNQTQRDKVLDRMAGTGPMSKAYLEKDQGKTSQYWTHKSDGSIVNKALGGRQCLSSDENDQIYMSACTGKNEQRWVWESTGQLRSSAFGKCLGLESENMNNANSTNPMMRDGSPAEPFNNSSKSKLILKNCAKTAGDDQFWIWY